MRHHNIWFEQREKIAHIKDNTKTGTYLKPIRCRIYTLCLIKDSVLCHFQLPKVKFILSDYIVAPHKILSTIIKQREMAALSTQPYVITVWSVH